MLIIYFLLNTYFEDSCTIKTMNKSLLFLFDGAYAYSPKRYNAYQSNHKDLSQIPSHVLSKINIERKRVSYTPFLDLVYSSKYPKTHTIIYSAQTSIKKSLKAIDSLKETKDFQIDVAGYSWGADAAMRFIRKLKRRGIKVNKVLTLDPVRRGLFFTGFIKSINGNTDYFRKEENVQLHHNIYQKTDKFSLPLIHIRGNLVHGADLNINLSEQSKQASHTNLHKFRDVQELFK